MTSALDLWHHCVANQTLDESLLDDEVTFFSPVIYSPIQGKMMVVKYLNAANIVFTNSNFTYVSELIDGNQACLIFEAKVNDLYINGIDFLTWNESQQLTEIRVFIRPLKAINALRELMVINL